MIQEFFLWKETSYKWLLCWGETAERSQTNHRWTEQAWWNEKKEVNGKCELSVFKLLIGAQIVVINYSPTVKWALTLLWTLLMNSAFLWAVPSGCFSKCLHDKRASSNMPCAFCLCKDEAKGCAFDLKREKKAVQKSGVLPECSWKTACWEF